MKSVSPHSYEESVLQPSRPSDLTSRMAVKFTLKRMTPLLLPAITVLVIPPLISISVVGLNIISRGYGVASILFALAFTAITCWKIKELAPSPQKLEHALQSRNRLLSLSLMGSLLLFRYVVSTTMPESLQSHNKLKIASLLVGARFATGILFLSILVMTRFVGPAAVAQCSTFPLHSNPYEKFLYNIGSFQRFLDLLLSHQEVAGHGSVNANHNITTKSTGDAQARVQDKKYASEPKRYKLPTFSKTIGQIFLHGSLGALFAQSTISPMLLSRGFDELVVYHVTCSCALMASLTFVASYVSCDRNHELTPRCGSILMGPTSSLNDGIKMIGNMLWNQIQVSGFLFYWLMVPFLGLLLIWFKEEGGGSGSMTLWNCAQAIFISHAITIVMVLYIMTCDIVQREILLQKGLNVYRFIQQAGAIEENVEVEDVIVEIILSGLGRNILEHIIAPRLNVGRDGRLSLPDSSTKRGFGGGGMAFENCDLEEEELRRNNAVTMVVKKGIEMGRICGHTSLEDDLLKICVLEGLSSQHGTANSPMDLPSQRHRREISRRIFSSGTSKGAQPVMVPVLRAMSAYVGGIGASLSDSTSTLSIPPSTKIALECAIKASTRFVVLNMVGSDASGRASKRYNRVSLMLPVILESIYLLRCGIYDVALSIHERTSFSRSHAGNLNSSVVIGKRGPWSSLTQENLNGILCIDASLEHLVNVCDEAASVVLQAIKDVDGSRDFDAKVRNEGCKEWLESFS